MPPVLLARCRRLKARGQICAPTRPDSFARRPSESSYAARGFSLARSTIARRRLRRTRRAKSIRRASHLVRADRALPEREVGSWFGRTMAGQYVRSRSEEHTSELQSPMYLVCRLLLEKKKRKTNI